MLVKEDLKTGDVIRVIASHEADLLDIHYSSEEFFNKDLTVQAIVNTDVYVTDENNTRYTIFAFSDVLASSDRLRHFEKIN